ncbi:hypothetical protein [Tropicibacter alexandrii]|uniref:hypothetical protein n=1 Tax=Tropicibacter alexandrii TaxID=2267683 RepID=UPI001008EF02|nr:hypothetical protein [Tropicibacter alexandrii]
MSQTLTDLIAQMEAAIAQDDTLPHVGALIDAIAAQPQTAHMHRALKSLTELQRIVARRKEMVEAGDGPPPNRHGVPLPEWIVDQAVETALEYVRLEAAT